MTTSIKFSVWTHPKTGQKRVYINGTGYSGKVWAETGLRGDDSLASIITKYEGYASAETEEAMLEAKLEEAGIRTRGASGTTFNEILAMAE